MKISLRSLITLVVAASTCAIAFADDLADFKKWYLKDSATMVKAMESKNIAFFDKICAPGFTYKEASGKVSNKKEALAGLKMMMDGTEKIKYKFKILSTKAVKNTMVVDLLNDYHMTAKAGPDGKKQVMAMENKTRETWVKVGSKWMLKNITDIGAPKMKAG